MRRSFTFVSVIVHAVVVASALVAQVLAVGPLPIPHRPLTFVGSMPIRLIDIPLPPPAPRANTQAPSNDVSPNAAPIVAPPDIRDETGREGSARRIIRELQPHWLEWRQECCLLPPTQRKISGHQSGRH